MIDELRTAQREVDEFTLLADAARERRAILFALAHERGMSSAEIARVLPVGVLPHHVQPVVRVGRGLLAARRRRSRWSERTAA